MVQITRQNCMSFTDRFWNGGVKRCFALLPMMLLTLLLLPTRITAQTTTEDQRCVLFNSSDGITDYVAEYDATNKTLTFKKNDADVSDISSNIVFVGNYNNVAEIRKALGNVTIKEIVFDKSFNTYAPTSLNSFFKNLSGLETITDLEYLNTANVTDMSSMFHSCRKLTDLDLSNLNTANVTNMSYMFNKCEKLTGLNLSNFNTANVKNMRSMFDGCRNLTELNLSNFNTANVTDMSYMFHKCGNLTELDLSKFNTTNVTSMSHMFSGCTKLASLDFSKFNTENVKEMISMFYSCGNLTLLDLYNFNTTKVMNMSYMFNKCSDLQTIYVSDNFVVTGITNEKNKKDMFTDCKALKGALPEYDATKTNVEFANYKTGYFTKLVVRNGDEGYGIAGETTQLIVDKLSLDDTKDLVVYDSFTATAASYIRTMEGTTWGTLCLPFEVSLDGQNFRAFELLSADERTNTIELEEVNTTIPAGTPVFIKMNEEANSLSFSVVDKEIANEVKTGATADGYQLVGLYATKMFDNDQDSNCYILKAGKLMNPAKILSETSTEAVGSKPFRAYMVDNNSSASGAKMFSISENGSTPTGIDQLTDILNDSNAAYYDLQGHRLSQPQKGINILKVGNKTMKIIIK
ncbi:BspA family leucine-rich repeat surface protein [uncultured Prevotella sp.]|uniref:BspA family leucine-rich repeat surface protein n=1 Tax=uncultured Prevotella sp. TaxID=159272 RepID=UPI0028063A83|nr:BspA family leucine-rich repeat surface protein [uncultured Prevotella sp.]